MLVRTTFIIQVLVSTTMCVQQRVHHLTINFVMATYFDEGPHKSVFREMIMSKASFKFKIT